MEIVSFEKIEQAQIEDILSQVKTIFFECSSLKNFRDDEHRESFFNKWCGDYLKLEKNHFYLAMDGREVLGYLSGHLNSKEALENFIIPGPEIFEDCFEKFPAHFHINCSPHHQGRGIGRRLVEHYTRELSESSINGVHLITSTDADNLGFYRALGFTCEVLRPFKSFELLLLGKEINA
ncbi:GNAT family N-acetyltransferase [Halobacteriovorax sp. HLS]|uniref:GNAT family N-acetyltransferase n=1 Tax=Halobacteriovorax sp. HLS TaxID=2234000 RepID=UPI000FD6FAC6|nr:GNAT family N-acetyltransferase [Halobacteriovorax sp. HLS]